MSTNASTTCPSACRNRSPRTLGTMTTVGLLILVQACASHTGRDSTQRGSSQWSYRISPTRQLTFLEMRRYDGLSMQEVTERRFPNAIRHREAYGSGRKPKSAIPVYIGGRPYGDIADLRYLQAITVTEMRFISDIEASTAFATATYMTDSPSARLPRFERWMQSARSLGQSR